MAKILLVEDDNNLREIYEARLQAEGYEIVSAHDGEQALTVAMKERPDLIISDVMMPKISGFDMLDIIRSTQETKDAKVIMMTALSQAEDKERASKLGADRYLVKSQVTLEDVARVAREVLNGEKEIAPKEAEKSTEPEINTADSVASETPTPTPVPTTDDDTDDKTDDSSSDTTEATEASNSEEPVVATEPISTPEVKEPPESASDETAIPQPITEPSPEQTPSPTPIAPTPTPSVSAVPTPVEPAPEPEQATQTPPNPEPIAPPPPTDSDESLGEQSAGQEPPKVPGPAEEAVAAASAVETAGQQTTTEEEKAITEQIESFIETKDSKEVESQSSESEIPPPAPASSPSSGILTEDKTSQDVSENDDNKVDASQNKNDKPDDDNSNSDLVGEKVDVKSAQTRKKVIQPINDLNESAKPKLEELVKKEAEKEKMSSIAHEIVNKESSSIAVDEAKAAAALRSAAREHPPETKEMAKEPESEDEIQIKDDGSLVNPHPEEFEDQPDTPLPATTPKPQTSSDNDNQVEPDLIIPEPTPSVSTTTPDTNTNAPQQDPVVAQPVNEVITPTSPSATNDQRPTTETNLPQQQVQPTSPQPQAPKPTNIDGVVLPPTPNNDAQAQPTTKGDVVYPNQQVKTPQQAPSGSFDPNAIAL